MPTFYARFHLGDRVNISPRRPGVAHPHVPWFVAGIQISATDTGKTRVTYTLATAPYGKGTREFAFAISEIWLEPDDLHHEQETRSQPSGGKGVAL